MTLAELGAAVTARARFRHLRPLFPDDAGTLIKPLTWQGDMSFAPPRDGQHTFQRLDDKPRWAGVWDLDEAGTHAVEAYLRTYGPATPNHLQYWLGEGLSAGRKRISGWIAGLDDRLVRIGVDGETRLVLREDVDELMATRPTEAVLLLPGHDQWVIGPGTKDEHVTPAARRTQVTRKANLVVAGGVVSGTWRATAGELVVEWFADGGRIPRRALAQASERLDAILGGSRALRVVES
jgi:hypothetical protein